MHVGTEEVLFSYFLHHIVKFKNIQLFITEFKDVTKQDQIEKNVVTIEIRYIYKKVAIVLEKMCRTMFQYFAII